MSRDNARFELESAILVLFKWNAPEMRTFHPEMDAFHYENTETSFQFYTYHQVRSFFTKDQ